jgi:hypothetical protein
MRKGLVDGLTKEWEAALDARLAMCFRADLASGRGSHSFALTLDDVAVYRLDR